jgi:tRNA threonylcarbamoyl adenosine modification protein YeaZ
MTLLAIDTSSATGSLAVAEVMADNPAASKHQINSFRSSIRSVTWEKRASHSEIATVKLSELLQIANLSIEDVSHFAVNVGPGSFTGIRVGLSLARSLAYSLGRPLAGINSLENLALAHGRDGDTVFVALKAVQNFFYCAAYRVENDRMKLVIPPQSAAQADLEHLSNGSTKVLIESITPEFVHESNAPGLLERIVRFQTSPTFSSMFSTWNQVEPLYIRGSEAEEKLKRGLLRPL